MLFLENSQCDTLLPIFRLLKNGVIPILQAAIIVILIVLVIIDLGKAVMAGKEDEIKSAQKLAIKRVVYALIVFLVPWIVNVAITMLTKTQSENESNKTITDIKTESDDAWGCWAKA